MTDKIYALPGTQCDEQVWQQLKPALAPDIELIHVVIPDKPSLTEIRQTLSEQLPTEPFHLLGFSLGGYVAAHFAEAYPERIASLHILANTPCALNDAELETRQQTLQWLSRFQYSGMARAKVLGMLSENPHAAHIQIIEDMDTRLGGEHLRKQLAATTDRSDLHESLRQLGSKLHFYASKRDALVNTEWLNNFLKQTPSAKLMAFESRSHMITLEFAEPIANALRENLSAI